MDPHPQNQQPNSTHPPQPKPPMHGTAMDVRTAPRQPTVNLQGGLAVPPPEEHPVQAIQADAQEAAKKPSPPRDRKTIVVIVVAVLIGLALAIAAVLAYMQTRDRSGDSSHSAISDVDETEKDVNETLKTIDNAKDFPESGLTDETLGL